jgi:hypothetical protein
MRTVFKYPIETTDTQELKLPQGSTILCVQVQNGQPCVWVILDSEVNVNRIYTLTTLGTGHRLSYNLAADNYLGTYQLQGGALVFHVFVN